MCRDPSTSNNTEMLDDYVTHIRHVAALLGYVEPQILEVFKNTLSMRVLTKENIDRQLAGP